jgi:hypothetical protein
MVVSMGLSGKERRILGEIEQALEQEDPDLARRVAAINQIEATNQIQQAREEPQRPLGERVRTWASGHIWVIALAGALVVVLLLLAVITA